jgi:hypothetical protein
VTIVNAAAIALVASAGVAHADFGPMFRIGVEPIALTPSTSTPYVGGYVNEAITAYNAASTAYNRAHGLAASSPMAASSIDAGDLGLHATLLTFAPGVDLGVGLGAASLNFRAEALLGVSDHVRAYGVGVYPLGISVPVPSIGVTPYLIGGATLRWLDRSDTDGEVGGLLTFRTALGARLPHHIVAELGVSMYAVGGVYNSGQLNSMVNYDPRGSAPPPPPDRAVSGGTQSGMIDFSVGFSL